MTEHDDQLAPIDGVIPAPPPSGTTPADSGQDAVQRPSLPPGGQPLAFPDTDAIQEVADLQRQMLAEPAANVIQGAPHFLRNVDGEEICGQCGEAFPCAAYKSMLARDAASALTPAGGRSMPQVEIAPPTMQEAAAAAGIDVAELQARLQQVRQR